MPETKEKNKEIPATTPESEIRIVDIGRENINKEPIPREIRTWMEKLEENPNPQSQIITEDNNQILSSSTLPQDPKIIIPITRSTFISGFKKNWQEAGLWLSTFWFRFIKIKDGKVTFKSHDTN